MLEMKVGARVAGVGSKKDCSKKRGKLGGADTAVAADVAKLAMLNLLLAKSAADLSLYERRRDAAEFAANAASEAIGWRGWRCRF